MNRAQEKILTSCFKRAFDAYKLLNALQVDYIFSCVSWLINPSDEELKKALEKRTVVEKSITELEQIKARAETRINILEQSIKLCQKALAKHNMDDDDMYRVVDSIQESQNEIAVINFMINGDAK